MTSCRCTLGSHAHHRGRPCENIGIEADGLCEPCHELVMHDSSGPLDRVDRVAVFADLVRHALTEWTSQTVERVRTDQAFAALLQNRWLALIGDVHHDRPLPVDAQLHDGALRQLLVMAIREKI